VRILVTSDLHYRLGHLDWLLAEAGSFDVVAIPGDHLDVIGGVPLEAQVVVVSKYLARVAERTTLLVSSGNHDLDGPGPTGDRAAGWLQRVSDGNDRVVVDGGRIDLGGIRFSVCAWWDGPASRALVDDQLEADAQDRPERWIWLYHSPPDGTRLCTTGRRDYPDPDLTAWIHRWRPDLVLCGHIHQAPWADGGGWIDRLDGTWVVNAGHRSGAIPPHVVIDTDEWSATWFTPPDRAEQSLR
jgi:Icc-related predicted phosphoesterase